MNVRKILLLALLFYFGLVSFSQDGYTSKELKRVAKEIITDAGVCAFTTLDCEGTPRTRAMDPFPVEEDFTIWMGTNSKSRKVSQIKNDDRVNLYYINNNKSGYVVVHGEAELINDPDLKEKYWKPEWEKFYSDKESNYLLIKVIPLWIEVLSPEHGINNDPVTWRPPVIKF